MTAPTAAHTSPAGEAPPEPRLPGPVRLLREVLPYVLALLLAFLVSGIVIAALGYDAIEAFRTILSTSFRTGFGFTETLTKWVPLVLLALGFTIPLAVGRFNIGGEGQLLVGATAAAGVGIVYADLPAVGAAPAHPGRRRPRRRRLGRDRRAAHGPVRGQRDPQHGAAELRVLPGARLRRHEGLVGPGGRGRGDALRGRGGAAAHDRRAAGRARRHPAGRRSCRWPRSW